MPDRELYLILNPRAGRGRAARAWARLEAALRARGARYEVVRTAAGGHAEALAARAAENGRPVVVAMGGDGTVHEVANGVLRGGGDGAAPVLGVVGAGSGNDFARMLCARAETPARTAQRLLDAEPRPVDVGRVRRWVAEGGGREPWHFVNGIGLGLDARVAVEASRIRRLRGMAVYGWALLRTLRDLRTPHVTVTADGEAVMDAPLLMATIANGARHGGSFWLCPDASIDDGRFDLLTTTALGLGEVLRLLPRVLRGTHLGHPAVALRHARRVSIRAAEPLPIHADGEIVARGVRELDVELLPGRLRAV